MANLSGWTLCATLLMVGNAAAAEETRRAGDHAPPETIKEPCLEDREISAEARLFIEALKDRIEAENLRLPIAPATLPNRP
jgi:hypothetical protein